MASSASPDLKIQLMATGENSGAWGTITNNNLSAIEEAIARTTDVAFSATATVAITLADSNALQQGRNYRLNLTGTGTAGQILLLPTVEKSYLIDNNLSVDVSVRNGTANGTNTFNIATVGAGRSTIVYTDGSAVTSALDSASSMVVLTTLDVGGAASVGGTFTLATANSTGNLGVVGNASVGGTFHIEGNTSAKGTLNVKGAVSVSSTLAVEGEINNEVGNLVIDPTTQIVEIKGGGSTDGTVQLNCRSNSHGQKIMSQPHSEGVTNEMLLPKGANSTLVSEAGTATITNKTLDVIPSISVAGTLNIGGVVTSLSTVLDADGNLRDIPRSRTFADTTVSAAQTDTGNFIFLTSADQTVVIPTASGTFDTGDIFSVVCAGASATISSNITSMFKVGEASATATITLGANKIASVLFVSAQHAYVTGT